jgi:hypothetical protein
MKKHRNPTAVSEPPAPPAGSTAAKMNALLDELVALIPDYTEPDPLRAPSVRANARFAHELITPTITAVSNYAPLQERNLFDVEAGRKALAIRDEFRPVVHRLAAILAGFDYSIDLKLAMAAGEALQTYDWSRRQVRLHIGDGVRPYVTEMQRVVEKALNRRTKKQPAPGTPGAPAPQSFLGDFRLNDNDAGDEADLVGAATDSEKD